MPLSEFTRVIGYIPSDDGTIPWLFQETDSLGKLALLVGEHARLKGADAKGIEAALMEWFSDPDLRLHWLEKDDVPLLVSAKADESTATLRLSFRTCILTFDELDMAAITPDPT